jgi:putative tryptophan/tyrosine transport system substrate-binding protein
MKRKITVLTLSAMLLALSVPADAQQPGKIPRIGILVPGSSAFPTSARYDSFRQGLRDLGYIEGKNIFLEIRYAEAREIGFLILLPNWLSSRWT